MPNNVLIIALAFIVLIAIFIISIWPATVYLRTKTNSGSYNKLLGRIEKERMEVQNSIWELTRISDVKNLSVAVKRYYHENQHFPRDIEEMRPFLEDEVAFKKRNALMPYKYKFNEKDKVFTICTPFLVDTEEFEQGVEREYCEQGILTP